MHSSWNIRTANFGAHQRAVFRGASTSPTYWNDRLSTRADPFTRARSGHVAWQLQWALGKLEPGSRVLEAGCGMAHFSVAMMARGHLATALDWSPDLVDSVRSAVPELNVVTGDVRDFEFEDRSFDLIYSPGVLEHFEAGIESMLAEHRRVLAVGGLLILTMPYLNRFLSHADSNGANFEKLDFYQYAFADSEVRELLAEAGLDLVRHRTYGAYSELQSQCFSRLPKNRRSADVLARLVDAVPLSHSLGHSGIWVARRR